MARQQAGESKAPLVIALAFFVLTTLGLGVLAYMFYGEIEQADASVAEAKTKADAAVTLAETEKAKAQMYRNAVGTGSDQDRTDLENLRPDAQTAVQAEFDAFQQALVQRLAGAVQTVTKEEFVGQTGAFTPPEKLLVWRKTPEGKLAAAPDKPLVDQMVKFYADQQLAQIDATTKQKEAAAAKKDAEQAAADLQAIKDQYQAELDKVPTTVAALSDKFEKIAQTSQNKFVTASSGYADDIRGAEKKQQDLVFQMKRLQDEIARLRVLKSRLEEQQAAEADHFAYDKPHGKIIAKRGQTVDIDLGSADNVRTGLTFAVHPSNTPDVGMSSRMQPDGQGGKVVVPKAQLEVIEVLGPGLSRARITKESNRIRDAVLTGDLLYNSAWRKGSADHVALFGIFDINGDGTDDINLLRKELTSMGIIVDAWYDLGKKEWVGELTEKTIYAIEGNMPFKAATLGANESVRAAQGVVRDAINEARKDVVDRGTHLVKMRDFFPRIGYSVNLDVSESRINQAASRYLIDEGGKPAEPEFGGFDR